MRAYRPQFSLRTGRADRTDSSLRTDLALRSWRARGSKRASGTLRSWWSLSRLGSELLPIEMPTSFGILNELSAVRVRSGRDEQSGVLIYGRVTAIHRDHAEDKRIVGRRGRVVRIEANAHRLQDECWRSVETKRFSIRVLRRDHDAEVTIRVRERKRRRRIERESNPVRRERHAWIHVHRIGDSDPQPPADVTETDRAPEVEHSISQSVLEMRQMLG